ACQSQDQPEENPLPAPEKFAQTAGPVAGEVRLDIGQVPPRFASHPLLLPEYPADRTGDVLLGERHLGKGVPNPRRVVEIRGGEQSDLEIGFRRELEAGERRGHTKTERESPTPQRLEVRPPARPLLERLVDPG